VRQNRSRTSHRTLRSGLRSGSVKPGARPLDRTPFNSATKHDSLTHRLAENIYRHKKSPTLQRQADISAMSPRAVSSSLSFTIIATSPNPNLSSTFALLAHLAFIRRQRAPRNTLPNLANPTTLPKTKPKNPKKKDWTQRDSNPHLPANGARTSSDGIMR
jgi:hypothetical protein